MFTSLTLRPPEEFQIFKRGRTLPRPVYTCCHLAPFDSRSFMSREKHPKTIAASRSSLSKGNVAKIGGCTPPWLSALEDQKVVIAVVVLCYPTAYPYHLGVGSDAQDIPDTNVAHDRSQERSILFENIPARPLATATFEPRLRLLRYRRSYHP